MQTFAFIANMQQRDENGRKRRKQMVRLKDIAEKAETIELSEVPEFGPRYISYMGF